MAPRYRYETLTGYFKQDDPTTHDASFDFTDNFGLIDRNYDESNGSKESQWRQLAAHITHLNYEAADERYHLLVLGRHGEGWHNCAEAKYGTKAWDDYYSKLDEDDGNTLVDAHLTEKGKGQARTANGAWKKALAAGMPWPESYYVSPLDRCLETCKITFAGLDFPQERPFMPNVRELLREVYGQHTCDKRSSKSYIASHYPYQIEDGFAEEDPFWTVEHRETDEEQEARLRKFLDQVFAVDDSTYISMTAHSGAIRNILKVLGHREFGLQTGGVIPVLIKRTTVV